MIRKIKSSIRAKGTITAIFLLFIACFAAFFVVFAVYLLLLHANVISRIGHESAGILMIFTLIICLILGSVFLYFALKRITKPIIEISNCAKEVAKGNFKVAVNVRQTKPHDEIGVLAENFNLMVTELSNMEYLRKDFMSNVSHEFKTPLASISGVVELISDKNFDSSEFQKYSGILKEETQRLSKLCSNMLKLSKLDHQAIYASRKEILLDEQIRKTVVLLENLWSPKNLDFDLQIEKILYNGDEELLQQIWLNLIENAIKFSDDSSVITISAKDMNNCVVVSVNNNGNLIPEDSRPRIFEKFYQTDKSHSVSGNGLGLPIVHRIVEIIGGKIEFASTKEHGTTFTITLPNS